MLACPLPVAQDDVVRGAIVADSIRVVDGDVLGPPVKLVHWIATRVHDVGNEAVGFIHRTARIIDELLLHERPLLEIPLLFGWGQCAKFEVSDTLFPFGKNGFSALEVSLLADDAFVFGAEGLFETLASATTLVKDCCDDDNDGDHSDDDRDQGFLLIITPCY